MEKVIPLVALSLLSLASAHSYLNYPEPISPNACRVGDNDDREECPGPCQANYKTHPWTNFSPFTGKTAVTFERGQNFKMKYTRNNHVPGGFIRLSIVPIEKTMDKAAHDKGAFHYSCWGGGFMETTAAENEPDEYGFNYRGSDGDQHPFAPGYYSVDVTIPTVVPDGLYMFGWAWFGGLGSIGADIRNEEQDGKGWSFFGDYWSCSYIEIKGGAPLGNSFTPEFVNTKPQFSSEGCRTSTTAIGLCAEEPCEDIEAFYGVPKGFENGKTPAPITPETFGGRSPARGTSPPATDAPTTPEPKTAAPTTKASTTRALTTQPSITTAPATQAPMTLAPTTLADTTQAPTTTDRPATTTARGIALESTTEAQTSPESEATEAPGTTTPARADTTVSTKEQEPNGMHLELISSGRNAKWAGLRLNDGDKVCPSEYNSGFSVACKGTAGKPKTVKFFQDGQEIRTERYEPYTIHGDFSGWVRPWRGYERGVATELKCETDSGASGKVTVTFKC